MRMLIIGLGIFLAFQLTCLASSKEYYEAMVNLQMIEKYFTGTPIYLSDDKDLKDNLRIKLNKIIGILEAYYQTNPGEPDKYYVLFSMGKAYSFSHDLDVKGAWEKSANYLEMALDARPKSEEALLIQAKNFTDSRNDEEALKLYDRAVAANPAGRGRLYRALTKISLRQQESAKNDLEKHLEIYPADDYAQKVLMAIGEE